MIASTTSRMTVDLDAVGEYVSFLDSWFTSERWTSTDLACPLRCGRPTSAEIAYAMLRFGQFHSPSWSQWRRLGFVALDRAIDIAVLNASSLISKPYRPSIPDGPAAANRSDDAWQDGRPHIVRGEHGPADPDPSQDPLIRAVALHILHSSPRRPNQHV